jgi:hypothetical protein
MTNELFENIHLSIINAHLIQKLYHINMNLLL